METIQVETWVMVDESGDYVASHDSDQLAELYDDQIGSGSNLARRKVKITLTVPLPKPIELTGIVPQEETTGSALQVN